MIPDNFHISNLSYCYPEGNSIDDDLMAIFEDELTNSQTKSQSNPPIRISSPTPSPPAASNQSQYSADEYKNEAQKSSNLKRNFFTKDEDHLLTRAAIKYKQSSWNKIAQCVPGKTPKQCRDRWTNYLQPSLNFEPWSSQEDQLLISLVNKYGTHWTRMKKHFPNRSTNSMKNRWYKLIKNQEKAINSKKMMDYKANRFWDSQFVNNYYMNECTNNNISNNNNFIGNNLNYNLNYYSNIVNPSPNLQIQNNKNINNNIQNNQTEEIKSLNELKSQNNISGNSRNIKTNKKKNINNQTESNLFHPNGNDMPLFDFDEINW